MEKDNSNDISLLILLYEKNKVLEDRIKMLEISNESREKKSKYYFRFWRERLLRP
jgi:hypothetical protein